MTILMAFKTFEHFNLEGYILSSASEHLAIRVISSKPLRHDKPVLIIFKDSITVGDLTLLRGIDNFIP